MSPKLCFPLSLPKLRLADEKSTNSHTIQQALSLAKQHTVTLSRQNRRFPLKYFSPKGQALELYELLGKFSEEISVGAREMEGNLRRVSDFMIADQVLKDLEGVEKTFRRKVLDTLDLAVKGGNGKKKGQVEWEELIWETRKLRRKAGKALGVK